MNKRTDLQEQFLQHFQVCVADMQEDPSLGLGDRIDAPQGVALDRLAGWIERDLDRLLRRNAEFTTASSARSSR